MRKNTVNPHFTIHLLGSYFRHVAVVRVLIMQADFVFLSDIKYVAAISEDGYLRVIDTLAEACGILSFRYSLDPAIDIGWWSVLPHTSMP
jgi:hypothetical protein